MVKVPKKGDGSPYDFRVRLVFSIPGDGASPAKEKKFLEVRPWF